MKYGISCNAAIGFSPTAEEVLRFARAAEEIGFHSILVSDHVLTPSTFDASTYPAGVFESRTPWYDPVVLLAAIAAVTKTIKLGTGIIVTAYRPPIQQAQAVATLDFISGGRFFYGAGVGWMRDEFDALGIPFTERGQRADEYIEVMKLLWSGSGEGFHGKFVDFDGGHLNPLPVQRPHPPIIIGGETPPAIRRIARYGDGFYINWKSIEQFRNILDWIDANMAEGRGRAEDLYQQMGATDVAIVREAKDRLPEYEAMGLDEIILSPTCASLDEGLATISNFARDFF